MKKKMFIFAALFMKLCSVQADDVVVNDITIPQGGEATLNIELNNTAEYTRFSLDLVLPEGITVTGQRLGERFSGTDHTVKLGIWSEWYRFLGDTDNSMVIPGTSGTLVAVTLKAEENLAIGSTYQATLSGYDQATGKEYGMEFTTPSDETVLLGKATFTITIGEPADPRTILDETSTTVPEATDGDVDILVKRTINAGEWSTLVLPFDMTEAQVKEAFGDDVELYEFVDYKANDDNTEITVNFDEALLSEDGLMANNPYIIKTLRDITEFEVTATIDPNEEGAVVEYTNGRSGSKKVVYGSFQGTYHAGTVVPENALFLSDSKFWYSTGLTTMKAFRSYFEFQNVLPSVGDAGAKVNLNFNGRTGLAEVTTKPHPMEKSYNLLGQRVDGSYKGIVILKGKKVKK